MKKTILKIQSDKNVHKQFILIGLQLCDNLNFFLLDEQKLCL